MTLWVFDNDGTLYGDFGAGEQFQAIFNSYIAAEMHISEDEIGQEVKKLKEKYNTDFSLIAVMKEFDVDFAKVVEETYLKIDLDACGVPRQDHEKSEVLSKLPGKKVVFTNNPSDYAKHVLSHMGLLQYFDDVIGMEETGFVLKPKYDAYRLVNEKYRSQGQIIFVDDRVENLDAALEHGWKTMLATYYRLDRGENSHHVADTFSDLLLY